RGSAERGEHGLAVDLRLFPCLRNQRLRDFIDRLAALAGEVLDLELEPPEGAEAGYRRGFEAEHPRLRNIAQLLSRRGEDLALGQRAAPLVPRLEDREHRRGTRLVRPRHKVEPADRDAIGNPLLVPQY